MSQTWDLRCLRRPGLCLVLFGLIVVVASGRLGAESGIQPEVACPPCDDFNTCTVDSCDTVYGTCRHPPLNCDDGNPCTTDSCTPGATPSCKHTGLPLGTACDDHNSCSIADVCNGSQQCRGTFLPLESSCSDGNGCTTSDTCQLGGICRGNFLNVGDSCDDGSLCTSGETCVDVSGTLTCQGAGPLCNDSNPCTQDQCDESTGLCVHPPVSCEDGNSCTGDSCDPATGNCVRTFTGGACNDGDFCTTPDACANGNCTGPPRDCDDGVACTANICDRTLGLCDNSIPIPGACDDGNPCTADLCGQGGCFHQAIGGPCTPLNKCLQPFCRLGSCGGFPEIVCNDGNACTFDACNQSIGCVFTPISCNDGLDCTVDTCAPQSGCVHTHTCDDGNACTADSCTQSGCVHPPVSCDDRNVCTLDTCNPSLGCVSTPFACDDGNACTVDSCSPGAGCDHTSTSCDDGIACTLDSCDPMTGCAHAPNCDDGNPCTTDVCDASGCTHLPIPGTPLSIQVGLTPSLLFPPNHRMLPVTALVTASGSCGAALTIRLDSITSSEPDDAAGSGDGRTTNDIQGAAFGTADFTFALRAERAGEGPGRTYRVTYSATDALGRAAAASAQVVVPIGRAKGPKGTGAGGPVGPNPDDPGAPKPGAGPGRN